MVASIFGLLEKTKDYVLASHLAFSFPLLIVAIQVPVLLKYFRYDTPEYYEGKKEVAEQLAVYRLIYVNTESAIHKKFNEQHQNSNSFVSSDLIINEKNINEPIPLIRFFFSPLRRSVVIGSILCMLQQLTGINAVIFYSSQIFNPKDKNDPGDQSYGQFGTLLVGIVNCFSSALGIYMLNKFKRKFLLYNGMIGMAICLSVLSFVNKNHELLILFSLLFLICFEVSIGPIMWLYISEILLPEGAGIAYAVNWIGVIILSMCSLFLFEKGNRKLIYLMFASFCSIGILFIMLFVKETRGLTNKQCKQLYFPSKSYGSPNYEPIDYDSDNDNDESEILINSSSRASRSDQSDSHRLMPNNEDSDH